MPYRPTTTHVPTEISALKDLVAPPPACKQALEKKADEGLVLRTEGAWLTALATDIWLSFPL